MKKDFYKDLFAFLKEKKKIVVIVAVIYLVTFLVGLLFPNFLQDYQKSTIISLQQSAGNTIGSVFYTIFVNNVFSAALGIFTGIIIVIPLALLVLNGYIFGSIIAGNAYRVSLSEIGIRFFPHGIFEIPMIILSFSLGAIIGMKILERSTWERPRKRSFILAMKDYYKKAFLIFVAIIIPILAIAALIESCVYLYANNIVAFFTGIGAQTFTILFSIILLFLFYGVLKLLKLYQKERHPKYLIIVSFIFFITIYLWMNSYGVRVRDFFQYFEILFISIPMVFFLFYSYLEHKRYQEEEAKKKIKGAFQQYMAPEIVEEIQQNPDMLKLGGEKKNITIFFSDVRSFTSISEKMSPEELVHFLNEYLSAMTGKILKNRGVVDKYIGDAIMSFWGAPLDEPEHPTLAAKTALEMLEKLKELQVKWKSEGRPEIKIGIGMNTGDVVVGNMGSEQRFDYTIMGDSVNLASRLESLTKEYLVPIVISQYTYERIKDKFVCRELDLVAVKGKKEPVKIYELICEKDKIADCEAGRNMKSGSLQKFTSAFEAGLDLYRKQKWREAALKFKEAYDINSDELSRKFIDRCKGLSQNPPGKSWDGVYVMKTK